jgi:hypothetical protein
MNRCLLSSEKANPSFASDKMIITFAASARYFAMPFTASRRSWEEVSTC